MTRNHRKYDEDFKQGAVKLVAETGKPIAQVACELGVNEGTPGNWCARAPGCGWRGQCRVERDRAGRAGSAAQGEHRAELKAEIARASNSPIMW